MLASVEHVIYSPPQLQPCPVRSPCQPRGRWSGGRSQKAWRRCLARCFLVWELYVVLPCCYLSAQSKVHELWEKKQFERLSKPGSIASVGLSQDGCGCPFGVTTLGFTWTNVGHGPCQSHSCVGKCFISSQGTATKDDAIMLPRSQFVTSSSWLNNGCTWIGCFFGAGHIQAAGNLIRSSIAG